MTNEKKRPGRKPVLENPVTATFHIPKATKDRIVLLTEKARIKEKNKQISGSMILTRAVEAYKG